MTADAAVDASVDAVYRSLVDSLHEHALFALSPAGIIVAWSAGAQRTFGYAPDEIIDTFFGTIFTEEDARAGAPEAELRAAADGRRADYERWHLRKDGTRFWGTNVVVPVHAPDGALTGFTKLVTDTTEQLRAREALAQSEERFRLLIESVPDYAILSISVEGKILSWNAGAASSFGYSDEILGSDYGRLFSPDDNAKQLPALLLRETATSGFTDAEFWLRRHDGSMFLASVKLSRLRPGSTGESAGFVYVAHDITDHRRRAEEMHRRASLDPLTHVANRSTFFEHVARAIAALKRHPASRFAILFIDLDHFKRVNETLGHMGADQVLSLTARRLEQCARSEDLVARIGGDEFAILLNGVGDVSDARDAAERIRLVMQQPLHVDSREVRVSASIGIALATSDHDRPEDILQAADVAMYAAKAGGRARLTVFNGEYGARGRSRSELQLDVRHAVERNELVIFYQPLFDLQRRSLHGFEALVRWRHPRYGLLGPAEFIRDAETHGHIGGIDRFVLREAAMQLAWWRERFHLSDLCMSVNLSCHNFRDPQLPADLRAVLAASRIPPSALQIEVTETQMMEHSEQTDRLVAAVQDCGVRIALDDFGVAYSTIAALARIPAHTLKIDRCFVTAMDSASGSELIRQIVHFAHCLGFETVAEGIETVAQLESLIAMGCTFGQGYWFSEPVDADAALELVRLHAAHRGADP